MYSWLSALCHINSSKPPNYHKTIDMRAFGIATRVWVRARKPLAAFDISNSTSCKPFGSDHSKNFNKVITNASTLWRVKHRDTPNTWTWMAPIQYAFLSCWCWHEVSPQETFEVLIPMNPPTISGLKLGHQHSLKPWSLQVSYTWTSCMLFCSCEESIME